MHSRKPILVTGSHRSGTTWIGRMLAEASSLLYVHEPFSVTDPPSRGICNTESNYWFTYVTRENEASFYGPIKNTIQLRYDLAGAFRTYHSKETRSELRREYLSFLRHRLKGSKPLIKDPMAFFSAEWLAERFDMDIVMIIRHPAAFVSSIKKLNWHHPLLHFLEQPALIRERLYPFAREIRDYASREHELLDQAILLWRLIHYTIIQYRETHPNWIFVRHEDLSRKPIEGFRALDSRLGLEFLEQAQQAIEKYSSSTNPSETDAPVGSEEILMRNSASNIWNWKKRLTAAEIERIKNEVEYISRDFYSNEDW